MSPPLVHIHYARPPTRQDVFTQHLIQDSPDVKVTFAPDLRFSPPLRIHGGIALETGSDAVWFTFPGQWHDIGLFHRADGTPTGTYANILTPPRILDDGIWHTTDLFLDLWIAPDRSLSVLDLDQFEEAVESRWIEPETARAARAEVARLTRAFEDGHWPPPVVAEWSLDRARAAIR